MAFMADDGRDRTMLGAFLANHDVPCPNCGYNLRELTCGVCPECGMELELRVGLVEPRPAAWVGGLVGIAAGMGFFAMVLLIGVYQLAFHGFREWVFFAWFVSLTAAHVVPLAAWLRWRPWLRTRSRSWRVLLAVCCWVLPVISMLLLVAFAPV
jgi:hypothetical protein